MKKRNKDDVAYEVIENEEELASVLAIVCVSNCVCLQVFASVCKCLQVFASDD